MRWLICISLSILILASCNKAEDRTCFKKAGNQKVEFREIGAFTSIDLSDNINLILVQDTVHAVSVAAGENLMNSIVTEIKDSVLYLYDENKCSFLRSYKNEVDVTVSFIDLEFLFSRGDGEISNTDTLKLANFTFDHESGYSSANLVVDADILIIYHRYGGADITMSGLARQANYYQFARGSIDCSKVVADDVWLKNGGSNDMHVQSAGILNAKLEYLGNVYYYFTRPDSIVEVRSHEGKVLSKL